MTSLENVPFRPSQARAPSSYITLPVRDVFLQTARCSALTEDKTVTLRWESTIGRASEAAAEAVRTNNTPLMLTRTPLTRTPADRNAAHLRRQPKAASSDQETSFAPLKIRSSNTSPIGDPRPMSRSPAAQEALRRMRDRVQHVLGKQPYAHTMSAGLFERVLPCLPSARLKLYELDNLDGMSCTLPDDALALYDIGCYVTTISEDLVDPNFLTYVRSPSYVSSNDSATIISVDAKLRFSNIDIEMVFVCQIVPVSNMPNGTSGILLGQFGLIDHMQIKSIPRALLEEDGAFVEEDKWGDFIIERYYDIENGRMVHL